MAMQPVPFHPRMYAQSPAVSYEPLPLIPGVRLRSHVPVERYGIGWFGVFVTWLVTMTLGCLLAANLTGHVRHLTLVGSVGSVAKPPVSPVTSPPPAAPVAAAPVAATVTTPSALTVAMPAAATGLAAPLPEVGVADLPRAPALASAASPRHHARSGAVAWRAPKHSAPAAAAPAQDDDDTDEADAPAEAPAPKPAPVAAKRAVAATDSDATDSAPAAPPKAEPAPAPAPPKPAPKVTFAAGSLEDMIQKEVEKEQKKLHHK